MKIKATDLLNERRYKDKFPNGDWEEGWKNRKERIKEYRRLKRQAALERYEERIRKAEQDGKEEEGPGETEA
jgi:hypothetical protein